jgi:hypothetical protein
MSSNSSTFKYKKFSKITYLSLEAEPKTTSYVP